MRIQTVKQIASSAFLLGVISLTATIAAAQTAVLEANPNQKQLEAGIYQYFEAVQALDPTAYANMFAVDGTLEDPAGGQPFVGRSAIAAAYGGGLQILGRITPRIRDMFVGVGTSTEVTVRWTLIAYTKQGKQVVVEGIGIFKFKPFHAGDRLQLASVREFYDPVQFVAQLQ